MHVEIKQLPEIRLAAVRHIGAYNQLSEAYGRLASIAERAGLFGPGTLMIGLYYDDPDHTPEHALRSDAAISVSPDAAIPEGLTEQHIRAGRYACATHIGPYDRLGDAWRRFLGELLPATDHRMGEGVGFEIYRNTPMETPAEQLRTELYVPIA